jgi:two-component system alkaline phosphatase synthesis response regulator PhoP
MSEGARILIIEDDLDTAEAMKITLEAQRHSVVIAPDPEQGLSEAKKIKPDLIILDVMFGKKQKSEGFEYAVKMKQVKELAPIPILMVTAVNIKHPGFQFSPDTDGEFLPVDDFIDKPAQPQDLANKVQKLLELKVSKWKDWPRKAE